MDTFITALYRDNGVYRGYIGIMEKNMETSTIMVYIRAI